MACELFRKVGLKAFWRGTPRRAARMKDPREGGEVLNQRKVNEMQARTRGGLALAAVAALIACFALSAVADDATSRVKGGVVADSLSVTETVDAIDLHNRIITLKDENGVLTDFKVSNEVRNLGQVKAGDYVVATYHKAIAYEVFKPGSATPGVSAAMVAKRAEPGEKPAARVTRVQSVTGEIIAIDKGAAEVTLKIPGDHQLTVTVKDPNRLDGVSVGDLVHLTYSQALVIAVKPAAAK
jgi:Cu/Ag efflux protein CusF